MKVKGANKQARLSNKELQDICVSILKWCEAPASFDVNDHNSKFGISGTESGAKLPLFAESRIFWTNLQQSPASCGQLLASLCDALKYEFGFFEQRLRKILLSLFAGHARETVATAARVSNAPRARTGARHGNDEVLISAPPTPFDAFSARSCSADNEFTPALPDPRQDPRQPNPRPGPSGGGSSVTEDLWWLQKPGTFEDTLTQLQLAIDSAASKVNFMSADTDSAHKNKPSATQAHTQTHTHIHAGEGGEAGEDGEGRYEGGRDAALLEEALGNEGLIGRIARPKDLDLLPEELLGGEEELHIDSGDLGLAGFGVPPLALGTLEDFGTREEVLTERARDHGDVSVGRRDSSALGVELLRDQNKAMGLGREGEAEGWTMRENAENSGKKKGSRIHQKLLKTIVYLDEVPLRTNLEFFHNTSASITDAHQLTHQVPNENSTPQSTHHTMSHMHTMSHTQPSRLFLRAVSAIPRLHVTTLMTMSNPSETRFFNAALNELQSQFFAKPDFFNDDILPQPSLGASLDFEGGGLGFGGGGRGGLPHEYGSEGEPFSERFRRTDRLDSSGRALRGECVRESLIASLRGVQSHLRSTGYETPDFRSRDTPAFHRDDLDLHPDEIIAILAPGNTAKAVDPKNQNSYPKNPDENPAESPAFTTELLLMGSMKGAEEAGTTGYALAPIKAKMNAATKKLAAFLDAILSKRETIFLHEILPMKTCLKWQVVSTFSSLLFLLNANPRFQAVQRKSFGPIAIHRISFRPSTSPTYRNSEIPQKLQEIPQRYQEKGEVEGLARRAKSKGREARESLEGASADETNKENTEENHKENVGPKRRKLRT